MADVVALAPKPAASADKNIRQSDEKWGLKVMSHGYSIVPSIFIKGQRRLGLDPMDMNIILHLMDHWWVKGRRPFPTKDEIAGRMGVRPRSVQRRIAALEKAGLITRAKRIHNRGGQASNYYDLSGLAQRLQQIEPDFVDAAKKSKAEKLKALKPKAPKP